MGFTLLMALVACTETPSRQTAGLQSLTRDAEMNYQSGRLDAARKQYEALLAANPKHAIAHVRLGAIAYRQGDSRTARSQFEQAARIDPANGQAKYNLAMLSLNEARQYLQDYVAVAPLAGNRQSVLSLLSQLNEFGRK
jgi:tetratricopeptide (TPR) repeat protein